MGLVLKTLQMPTVSEGHPGSAWAAARAEPGKTFPRTRQSLQTRNKRRGDFPGAEKWAGEGIKPLM